MFTLLERVMLDSTFLGEQLFTLFIAQLTVICHRISDFIVRKQLQNDYEG